MGAKSEINRILTRVDDAYQCVRRYSFHDVANTLGIREDAWHEYRQANDVQWKVPEENPRTCAGINVSDRNEFERLGF